MLAIAAGEQRDGHEMLARSILHIAYQFKGLHLSSLDRMPPALARVKNFTLTTVYPSTEGGTVGEMHRMMVAVHFIACCKDGQFMWSL
jgi:hypothetical protein